MRKDIKSAFGVPLSSRYGVKIAHYEIENFTFETRGL